MITIRTDKDRHTLIGHSNVTITLDLYSHVSPTMQAEAVALMNKALGASR